MYADDYSKGLFCPISVTRDVNAVCDSTLHIDHYYITHFVTIIMFHVRTWNIIIVTKRVMLNHVISVLFLFYLNKLHILCTTSSQIISSYAKSFNQCDHLKQQVATYMFYKQSSSISHHIVFITKFQDIKLSFSIFSVSPKVRIEHYNSKATI